MNILSYIKKNITFFDGAMGTVLQSLNLTQTAEELNFSDPEIIKKIHVSYVQAGSDIITTNTFNSNSLKLNKLGLNVFETIDQAVKLARSAKPKFVVYGAGPTGKIVKNGGDFTFDQAYETYKEQVIAAKDKVDAMMLETCSDLAEAKAFVLACKENCTLPVFVTMTFQNGRTFLGLSPKIAATVLKALGVSALGVNCSTGPDEMQNIVKELYDYSGLPIIVQPNAGLPKLINGKIIYDIPPKIYAQKMLETIDAGAAILGGCCGTTPEFIKEMVSLCKGIQPKKINIDIKTAVTSATKITEFSSRPVIIGEMINPTGKKLLAQALRNNDYNYILTEAVSQEKAGADILDINAGLPDIDEKIVLKNVMSEVCDVCDLPLQIDSSDISALENAARYYIGKPVINSVNGKQKTMDEVFSVVKKYGGVVIGLTLDENGIPPLAEGRFEIAKKIVSTAKKYGIGKENILIDCLVLTASSQQKEVGETLKAIKLVKKLGVKTVLGVSNVSYGLPNRTLLNSTFLTMALSAGLDSCIINPLSSEMMNAVYAYNVLSNIDEASKEYISKQAQQEFLPKSEIKAKEKTVYDLIVQGFKDEIIALMKERVKTAHYEKIIDEEIIPALNFVGQQYDTGKFYLPQLLVSAQTAKNGFDVIKEFNKNTSNQIADKGSIVLATVYGDIHDIGKNIVKMMLENYGFNVLDLGKDVEKEKILETVKDNNIKLLGLSALMTTTVANMKDTISLIKKEAPFCKVMVGGAVLNEEYSKQIGADYYAADAKASVLIAENIFKK